MSEHLTSSYVLRRVPVHNKADILVNDQDLNDIIKAIKHYHKLHARNYDDISTAAWKGDVRTTGQHLFDFCKRYIKYKVEPEENQTIKSPGRIVDEGYGDCKHYSSFICGVVDSLERQGYPIHCCYRFVSDIPGKDVHHVFAVIQGKEGEYWVDPVLDSFDQRPRFHNVKDIAFSHGIGRLTYLSGTDAAVGKHGHGKEKFKKALQKIKHGVEVNAANAGKGVKKAAQAVKHLALKVGVAPARNAVLALLDINAFNLATRFSNALKGPKANQLRDAWKKMGGDPNKLAQAARNGLLFKAKLHHKDPKAVHGHGMCAGMGATVHTKWITTHPDRWMQEFYMPRHRRHRRDGTTQNMAMIRGAMVGIEPVSTASLMALASALLGVLSKFLDMHHTESTAMAEEAGNGAAAIAEQAAAADAAEGQDKADAMTAITQPSGGDDATMSVKTGIDEHGQPEVTVADVRHPALNNAGSPGGGAAADVATADDGSASDTPATKKGFLTDIEDKAKSTWANHKGLVIGTGIAILALSNKGVRRKLGMK